MNLDDTLKKIILKKVIPAVKKIVVSQTKKDFKNIEIENNQNLVQLTSTIENISKKYNIEMDKIFIGVEHDYDGGTFVAYFEESVNRPQKEIDEELKRLTENCAWKIVYDNMMANGFKRIGFNSSLLKQFDDTSVYQMIKNNEIDRLVNFYSFRYSL